MVSIEEGDDNLSRAHEELVNKLNLDKEAATKAWNSFETIRKNYSLEVCLLFMFTLHNISSNKCYFLKEISVRNSKN